MKKTNVTLLTILAIVLQVSIIQAQNSNPLFHAIWDKDMPKLKKLVASGMDINGYYDRTEKKGCFDCGGWTPYIAACVKGNMEAVKYLEQQGADIMRTATDTVNGKATYNRSQNALYTVSEYGNTKMINYLLGKGFDVESKTKIGFTALIAACQNNRRENFKAVKLLIEKGADIHAWNDRALFDAALRGYNKIINHLLDKGAKINAVYNDRSGFMSSKITPIYYAIGWRKYNAVKLLIKRGANVQKMKEARISPLHLAARLNEFYTVNELLKNGADKNVTDNKGQTPLDIAINKKSAESIRLLQGKSFTAKQRKMLRYLSGEVEGFKRVELLSKGKNNKLEAYTFKDINGKIFTMKDLRGKVVFINIWATWCGPCLREMPDIIKLQEALKGKPFVVLAISVDKKREDLISFQQKKKYPFTIVHNPKGYLWQKVLYGALPSTHIFDGEGKQVAKINGAFRWSEPKYVEFIKTLMLK
ncbi:MAG TPA: hypothetical protein DCS93_37190 [Microscillaceae bacterium]|nr:hypothetical protein [Microscillaceae bacterium]